MMCESIWIIFANIISGNRWTIWNDLVIESAVIVWRVCAKRGVSCLRHCWYIYGDERLSSTVSPSGLWFEIDFDMIKSIQLTTNTSIYKFMAFNIKRLTTYPKIRQKINSLGILLLLASPKCSVGPGNLHLQSSIQKVSHRHCVENILGSFNSGGWWDFPMEMHHFWFHAPLLISIND